MSLPANAQISASPTSQNPPNLAHLVQHAARVVRHLVKLVDAADAPVAQNERPALQHHLPGLGVLGHIGRQPHGRASPTAGVDPPGGQLVDVLQELRLRRARVTAQQDVDVAPAGAIGGRLKLLGRSAKQLPEKSEVA